MEIRIEGLEEGFVVSEFDGLERKEYAAISPTDALWRVQDLLIGDELVNEEANEPELSPAEQAQAILDEHGGDREAAIKAVAGELSSAYPELAERVTKLVDAAYPPTPKFKVGDRVQCKAWGLGTVTNVFGTEGITFPIIVTFDGREGGPESYTHDGNYFTDTTMCGDRNITHADV